MSSLEEDDEDDESILASERIGVCLEVRLLVFAPAVSCLLVFWIETCLYALEACLSNSGECLMELGVGFSAGPLIAGSRFRSFGLMVEQLLLLTPLLLDDDADLPEAEVEVRTVSAPTREPWW